MRQVSEGIAEAITLTLNRYDLTDEEYGRLYDGAADAFEEYINKHKPATVIFRIETCIFLDSNALCIASQLTEQEQEDLLHDAEAAADEWIDEWIEANV